MATQSQTESLPGLLYSMVTSSVSNDSLIKMKSSRALMLLAGLAVVCASGQSQTPVFSTGQAARLVIGQVRFTGGDFGATNSLLGSPSGIAYANGTLWVADSNRVGGTPNNNRVLRFGDVATYPGPTQDPTIPGSTCGVCRGQASLVLGQPDFVSSNSALTPTGMRSPTAVATDGNIVVVADTDNNRVLIWLSARKSTANPPMLSSASLTSFITEPRFLRLPRRFADLQEYGLPAGNCMSRTRRITAS